jgi:predicted amidohydrolase
VKGANPINGYCFDDVAHVRTSGVLETDAGNTVDWCKKHAVRLQCTVLCGYPRSVVEDAAPEKQTNDKHKKQKNNDDGDDAGGKDDAVADANNGADDDGTRGGGEGGRGAGEDGEAPTTSAAAGIVGTITTGTTTTGTNDAAGEEQSEEGERLYNALVVVGPDGAVLAQYHKSFLYCVDKTWASEGGGFISVPIPIVTRGGGGGGGATGGGGGGGGGEGGDGRGEGESGGEEPPVLASLGICMDINPREFQAPWWGAGGKGDWPFAPYWLPSTI